MRYLLFSIVVFLVSCSGQTEAERLPNEIKTAETQIGANPDATAEEVKGLLASYEKYTSLADADEDLSVDYLLRAGDMAARLKDYERGLKYYDEVLSKYPAHPKAAKALFMKGFTLDNKLGRLEEAKAVYEQFLEKYPEDDFANDAEFSLKNLGKSAEEIIKAFEEKRNSGE